jgi:hypothetical protein
MSVPMPRISMIARLPAQKNSSADLSKVPPSL